MAFSARELSQRCGVKDPEGYGFVRFCEKLGIIRQVGEGEKKGRGRGEKLYEFVDTAMAKFEEVISIANREASGGGDQ